MAYAAAANLNEYMPSFAPLLSHSYSRLLARALSVIRPVDPLSWADNLDRRSFSDSRCAASDLTSVNGVERVGLVCGTRDCARQRFTRIGEDLRIIAGAAQRHVKLLAIDQLEATRSVDLDQNPIDRSPLTGV